MVLKSKFISVLLIGLAVAGCSKKKSSVGPDEFNLLPTKPLEIPADTSALPTPVSGAVNRADKVPDKDAIAALGGNPSLLDSNLIARSEQPLVTQATRYGIDPDIRSVLASEDRKVLKRRGARLLERLSGFSNTTRAYKPYALDQEAEAIRLRKLGIKTPIRPKNVAAQ